ncbi:class I SAM-dependent methyltransferase [Cognaticolwellia aestuarii]|jgi:ubiquinone/menaquinone biosynthesis C-methylase UbiE|uniref:class I SAM-dependent methyltransferase n=1 Tax=Cognaticolwellia aestuarii TaxID=329993 RepID=UPI0007966617|nr:class I SAM-dependent methyltransferase [Cognaticolwellia aestuarii]KXJ57010.1 MAG: ubiquinone biosynthesis protein UbiE [Colwellia sp. Phe_37]
MKNNTYIPPLRFHWLTSFYDSLVAITTREAFFKKLIVDKVANVKGNNLLDVGCGTGTLTKLIAEKSPKHTVIGLDADQTALDISQKKVIGKDLNISFRQGFGQKMPFDENSFDIVVSSLFFHHLNSSAKLATLTEIRRVLKPDGTLIIADWGKPTSIFQRILFFVVQLLDGFETTKDNVDGVIPSLVVESGFTHVSDLNIVPTPLGTIRLIEAN